MNDQPKSESGQVNDQLSIMNQNIVEMEKALCVLESRLITVLRPPVKTEKDATPEKEMEVVELANTLRDMSRRITRIVDGTNELTNRVEL